jgi:2-keto-3-deoxy-L-rhamnonate aldolase RhmA
MKKNVTRDFRERLARGGRVFCALIGPGNDPDKTTAALKEYGYDFIMVENEHSLLDKETIHEYIRACHELGMPLLMRPEEKTDTFRCYLDGGVNGMMLPQVDTVEQAAYGVRLSYFPPIGHRGAGLGMSPYQLDGQNPAEMRLLEMLQYVNDNTVLFPMTESLEGLSNLAQILKLEGVSGTIVGTHDFVIDIAFRTGRIDPDSFRPDLLSNEYVLDRVRKIAGICAGAGKVAGIGGYDPKGCLERSKDGYQLFTLGYVIDGNVEKTRPLITEAKELLRKNPPEKTAR